MQQKVYTAVDRQEVKRQAHAASPHFLCSSLFFSALQARGCSKDFVNLVLQCNLRLCQICKVHEHEKVLHRVVEHGVELGWVNLRHGRDCVNQCAPNLGVTLLLAINNLRRGRKETRVNIKRVKEILCDIMCSMIRV